MSNPLARVVMNGIAQKSGLVEKRSSRSGNTGSTNLGKRETKLLTDLLNNKTSVKTSNTSYNKSTYGRSSNVSNTSNTMASLNSLAAGGLNKTETANNNTNKCVVDKSRPSLKSLCSLDNISVGKSNTNNNVVNNNSYVSKNNNRNTMQALKLDQLVKGSSKPETREVKTSSKQTGGMMTLGDFAGEKTKNNQSKQELVDNTSTSSSYVKSNVINNLEAYVPRVTLESIGKKGSLF